MTHTVIGGGARTAVLRLQRNLRLFPRDICLVSGAPRSGTTALCEWFGQQRDVLTFQESRILVGVHRFLEETHRFRNLDKDSDAIYDLARRLVCDYYCSSSVVVGKRLLLDKEPLDPVAFPSKDYGDFLTNFRRLFPESKLLFAIRDPIATVWSMTRRRWGESLTEMESNERTIEECIENWCSCADIVLQYRSEPHTYVVQFGRLTNDPENESRKINDFLDIRQGSSFQPRPTKVNGFSDEERASILRLTQPQLEFLKAQGIVDLG